MVLHCGSAIRYCQQPVELAEQQTESRPRRSFLIFAGVGIAAFAYRFLSANRLTNDHYMHLAWAQQVLLGDVPGRDFVDPGMPLTYALSALVQYVWPGPFSEVLLTTALLGAAAGLTAWVIHNLTRSTVAAVIAASVQVGLDTRLYSYPKVLVPAACLVAFLRYASAPSSANSAILAIVVAACALLRYDLGVFAAAAVSLGVIVLHAPHWRRALTAFVRFAGVATAVLAPYLAAMQYSQGLLENLREGLEFSKGEVHQLLLPWRELPSWSGAATQYDEGNLILYYVAYALIPGCAGMLLFARTLPRHVIAAMTVAVALLACYCLVILRHPLAARVPDIAAVLAITGTWLTVAMGQAVRRTVSSSSVTSVLVAAAAMTIVAAAPLAATWAVARPADRIERSRVLNGPAKVVERVRALARSGTRWPWTWYWPNGEMPDVVRYVADCTAPQDRVLLTWFAPEYYFFAQRGFAAGHVEFASAAAFATPRDNDKMVERIRSEQVPLVFRNEATATAFTQAYPELTAFIDAHYEWFDSFSLRDGSVIRMGAHRAMAPTRTYGAEGWPCGFVPKAAQLAHVPRDVAGQPNQSVSPPGNKMAE
jgi:hypothetical protein